MHKFKNLLVWQVSVDLSVEIYKATDNLPSKEKYNLISQINRAAVSIPSNIAEGAGRNSPKEFINFLSIANGSSYELKTQLLIAKTLNFLSESDYDNLTAQINHIQ